MKAFIVCGHGFSVDKDGNVQRYWFDNRTGEHEEHEEHISESPVRDAFPEWVWDVTLDPRR